VVAQARLLVPETTARPGGPLRQPTASLAARAVDVQRGDTLASIARRYSVNRQALIDANRLQEPYALPVGGELYLPAPNIHVVEPGETLYSISRSFNIDTRSLAVMNGLSPPWVVWPGDELVMPTLATVDYGNAGAPITPARPWLGAEKSGPDTAKPPTVRQPSQGAGVAPKGGFIWPVPGRVVSGFGPAEGGARNDGVDLAVEPGAAIQAAAAGQVVYAGSGVNGIGNLLLIQHPGGWVTAYAHSDTVLVREGDLVRQGQPIATVGSTGNAGGPQVHVELRKGKEPVDPSLHLPPMQG
jgi:murein DD-endopeptidase MepM/ murein hydrolase activator NlpD